jgi:hypothetical protein
VVKYKFDFFSLISVGKMQTEFWSKKITLGRALERLGLNIDLVVSMFVLTVVGMTNPDGASSLEEIKQLGVIVEVFDESPQCNVKIAVHNGNGDRRCVIKYNESTISVYVDGVPKMCVPVSYRRISVEEAMELFK